MDNRFIAGALVAAASLAAPMTAGAAPAKMTDVDFLRASRCVAFTEIPQLKADADMAWLVKEVKAQSFLRPDAIVSRADQERDTITRSARHSTGEAAIAMLRERRDQACAGLDKQSAGL